MNKFRGILPVVLTGLTLATLGAAAPTTAAIATDDAWVAPAWSADPGINIVDSYYNAGEAVSKLVAIDSANINGMPNETLCAGVTSSGACSFTGNDSQLDGTILLPECTSDSQTNCIAGLSMSATADGDLQPATFVAQNPGQTVSADPAHGLTAGSTQSLWTSSVANAAGEHTYSVYAILKVSYNAGTQQYSYKALTANVLPYRLINGDYKTATEKQTTINGRKAVSGSALSPECAWVSDGSCGRLEDFTDGTKVSLSLRLTSQLGGWFKGRVVNPDVSTSKLSAASQLITVTGTPAAVPMLSVQTPVANLNSAMRAVLGSGWVAGPTNLRADYPNAFDAVTAWRGVTQNTATAITQVWSIGSIDSSSNRCLADTSKVQGIVSTNAMVYAPGAPDFTNGTLNYQVAGMHYLPGGTNLVQGTYNLVMRSDTARCLYGFTSAPISATISVTSNDGTEQTAVTAVGETDGWLHLAALGFTFSNPKVSVKLSQAKAAASGTGAGTSSSGSATSGTTAKSTTITCIKGKVTKKVTGPSPKCPAGYKKK